MNPVSKTICNLRCYVLQLLLSGVFACIACAQKVTLHLEPAQAEIGWTLGGNLHTTHGSFKLKGGLMTFDTRSGIAEGEILVDADSGESGNATRDTRMKNEVLETQRYPEIFFHPTRIVGLTGPLPRGTSELSVEGMFNIHGADHPFKLNVKTQCDGKNVTATTNFVVPYVQWGMKDPSVTLFRVKKEVGIDIVAHGILEVKP